MVHRVRLNPSGCRCTKRDRTKKGWRMPSTEIFPWARTVMAKHEGRSCLHSVQLGSSMISPLRMLFLIKLQAPLRVKKSTTRTRLARSRGPYVPPRLRVRGKRRPSPSSVPSAVRGARGTVAGDEDLCDLAVDGKVLLKSMEMEVDLAEAEVCMSFLSDAKGCLRVLGGLSGYRACSSTYSDTAPRKRSSLPAV